MKNNHERYDVAFSLGAACACSVALRRAGLQFASFPLDWMAGGTLAERAALVASRFDGWLEKDDFVYKGPNPLNGLGMFWNRRTGLNHLHDFADGAIENSYAAVREKYRRRETRLCSLCDAAHRILCVYVSRPVGPKVSDEELCRSRRLLADAFPAAKVEIVHFSSDPERSFSDRRFTVIDEGAFRFEFDYNDPKRDVNVNAVARALVEEGFTAKDHRTAEEKRAYELAQKMKKYGASTKTGVFVAKLKRRIRRLFGIPRA